MSKWQCLPTRRLRSHRGASVGRGANKQGGARRGEDAWQVRGGQGAAGVLWARRRALAATMKQPVLRWRAAAGLPAMKLGGSIVPAWRPQPGSECTLPSLTSPTAAACRWGAVLALGLSDDASAVAQAVCRGLGYGGGAPRLSGWYDAPNGTATPLVTDLKCTGGEASLEWCSFAWSVDQSPRDDTLGVACAGGPSSWPGRDLGGRASKTDHAPAPPPPAAPSRPMPACSAPPPPDAAPQAPAPFPACASPAAARPRRARGPRPGARLGRAVRRLGRVWQQGGQRDVPRAWLQAGRAIVQQRPKQPTRGWAEAGPACRVPPGQRGQPGQVRPGEAAPF